MSQTLFDRWDKIEKAITRLHALLAHAEKQPAPPGHHRRFFRTCFETFDRPGSVLTRVPERLRDASKLEELHLALLKTSADRLGDTETLSPVDPVPVFNDVFKSVEPLIAGSDSEWTNLRLDYGPPGQPNPLALFWEDVNVFLGELRSQKTFAWKSADRDGVLMNFVLFRVGARVVLWGATVGYPPYF